MYKRILKISILSLIFSVNVFSQLSYNGNIRPDSLFYKSLRQGEFARFMREVPNRPDLQLERLAAYFFHQRINQYRLENGLTTLYWDDRMWLAARNHNVYMSKTKFGHGETKGAAGFTGESPSNRIQFVTYKGFNITLYGENILMNYSAIYPDSLIDNAKYIANESFEQWKNSPPHNKNMLYPDFFAEGTSFYKVGIDQVFGTTNFGNASDFVKNEITISWNDSLAKLFSLVELQSHKPYMSVKWSVRGAEKELFTVVMAKMSKDLSVYNTDFTHAADMKIKSKATNSKTRSAKNRYFKVASKPKLKYLLCTMHEITLQNRFTKEQLIDKSAFEVINEQINQVLTGNMKVKSWGGKCKLTKSKSEYICDIDLIYVL